MRLKGRLALAKGGAHWLIATPCLWGTEWRGAMPAKVAKKAGKVTKPVVAYIGGKAAKEGTRFSHAGAIIEGNRGTHAGKVQALTEAGATVVDGFGDLPDAALEALSKLQPV